MKAALLREYNQPLEIVERPVPEPQRPEEVCVKIEAAGVCATDLHAIEGLMEMAGMSVPRVLGHENAGTVVAVGDRVSTVSVGDPVILYAPFSCGVCLACRRGNDMHCEHHQFTGLTVDGGFAEYVVVAERSLVKLAPGVDLVEVAPHADAGITAYHAIKKVAHLAGPGTTTVVIGVGGVGHIGLQLVGELTSSAVVAVDPNAQRRALAEELGADEVLDSDGVVDAVRDLTDGRGADLAIDFVGTDETHAAGMEMLARGGAYAIVGFGGTVSVASGALVGAEQSVIGNLVGTWTDLWEVMQLHAGGRLTLKTEAHPLEAVNEVLDRLRAGEITGRAVLQPSANGAGG